MASPSITLTAGTDIVRLGEIYEAYNIAGVAMKTGISQYNDKLFLIYSGYDTPFNKYYR